MRRESPEERAAVSFPESVGLRSSERAPLARLPFFEPTLSVMRVIELRAVGAAESRISLRVLEGALRLPAASATRAVKEWVRLVVRLDVGVKDQALALTRNLSLQFLKVCA